VSERPDPATSLGEPDRTEVGSVFVSNYPPYSAWRADQLDEARAALARPAAAGTPLGLYLHVPFCRKRCKFCYFKVYTDQNAAEVRRYLSALATEATRYARLPAVAGRALRFVYFGGGTPSFISARDLHSLAAHLRGAFDWNALEEVTFECEPGTLTRPKLVAIREIGVTRLSLGIESFDDRILEENGRAHVSKEIRRVRPWIRAVGFDQLNVDLIAGMVGETWESWKATVEQTIDYDADSVTIYQLELPYNTVYSRRILQGESDVPIADWETKRAWHDHAIERFIEAGYEISSAYTLVKRGRGARFVYRDSVWQGCDLVGVGVASFSHVGGVHFQNEAALGPWLASIESGELAIARAFATDESQRLVRETILQLKLGRISTAYFRRKFGVEILETFAEPLRRLAARGMLEQGADEIRLTRQGLLRVDSLLPEFYAPAYRGARYT
jgi:oxygen-independent coproporphyrinogen-3 oxidase